MRRVIIPSLSVLLISTLALGGVVFAQAGWMVISSDRPVLPHGVYYRGRDRVDPREVNMQFYPVDCNDPDDDGASFACHVASPAS